MNWLTEQISLVGKYLRSDFRKTALGCTIGMIIAAVLGFALSVLQPDTALTVMNDFMDQIAQSGVIDEAGQVSVFALLTNNWRAMLVTVLYGLPPFLYLPLISLLTNGLLLGVMAGIYQANGLSLLALLAGLVPHGVFELPALVFSVACGVRLCRNVCLMVVNSPRKIPFTALAEDLLRVLVLLIAPLTVIAAFVECNITPIVMNWFL